MAEDRGLVMGWYGIAISVFACIDGDGRWALLVKAIRGFCRLCWWYCCKMRH